MRDAFLVQSETEAVPQKRSDPGEEKGLERIISKKVMLSREVLLFDSLHLRVDFRLLALLPG